MKQIICLIMMACWMHYAQSQTKIEREIPVKKGQSIHMEFTWPKNIVVKTWNDQKIKLTANVEINKGQNDDAFDFDIESNSEALFISSLIKNHEQLPKKILIRYAGEEIFFDTSNPKSKEIKEFRDKNGIDGFEYMTYGVLKDISIEVYIPRGLSLNIYSKYGMIELMNMSAELIAHSKFGGVDLSTSGTGSIKAGTRFVEKYTNLDHPVLNLAVGDHPGKWDWVQLGDDNKASVELKSEFGNIYIRKLL